jgi:carbohydrate kinase (thermoresistant glucokinase family)
MRSVVVMGVSGSGKTTIGECLAARLGLRFVDADALHPAANVEKMRAGIALTDEDRWPWLDAVGAVLAEGDVVVACSALRRAYRDRLRVAGLYDLVFLHGDRALLAERIGHRRGHFMPATLLQSQLDTLEEPGPDEHAVRADVAHPVDELVEQVAGELAARTDGEPA